MSFLTEILDAHKKLESPKSFWYWAALATISAVIKDNVYLDRGGAFNTYANIYVMLYADSGLKKGPPVALARRLVKTVNNTKVISGRSSIQGIMKELSTAVGQPGGKIDKASSGFICASEFSSAIVADPAAMTILTDLFDRMYNEGEWASLLKMDQFKLNDPTLTMLVATNEAHFEDFLTNKEFKGGFLGRMFVVAEDKVQQLNPLIRPMDIRPKELEPAWVKYLQEVAKLRGPFEPFFDTPAGDLYESWYIEFYETMVKQGIKDETGTLQRFGDSVLKVAMLLSLADRPILKIEEPHIREAIDKCERFVGSIRKTTMGKNGKSTLASQKALIMHELLSRENYVISRQMLQKKYYMHFSSEELDSIIQSFSEGGYIETSAAGGQILYTIPERIAKELIAYFKGKNQ